jgi:TolA-binding protein
MGKDSRSHVSSRKPRAGGTTSKEVAGKAARVLASDEATPDERAAAGSALAQAEPEIGDHSDAIVIDQLEMQLDDLRDRLAERDTLIADLTAQLNDANRRAAEAEAKADEQAAWAARQVRR